MPAQRAQPAAPAEIFMRKIIPANTVSVKRRREPGKQNSFKKESKIEEILLIFLSAPAILSRHFARKRIFFSRGRSPAGKKEEASGGIKQKQKGEKPNVCRIHEAAAGSRCPLRSPDPPLEPQDGRVHLQKLEEAYNFVRDLAANNQTILFVGTKKQATDAVKEEASRVGMYYVNARWLGGMLTNFKTMRTRVDRLAQLKKMQEDGTFDMLPKKEVMKHMGEMEKLEKYLGGVKDMKKLPGALFVVDPRKEHNAIAEARKLHIPIVAIVDTNCDPDEVDYVIPANDDAIRAIRLIASTMANAVQEGRQGEDAEAEETVEAPAEE